MAVFLLIGKTSALTMNVAGVIKDWLLIGLSPLLFQYVLLLPRGRLSCLVHRLCQHFMRGATGVSGSARGHGPMCQQSLATVTPQCCIGGWVAWCAQWGCACRGVNQYICAQAFF